MDLKLTGKTAFISGSTSGIGFATAKSLAEEGCHVIINGRTEKSIAEAIKQFNNELPHSNVKGIAADFSILEEIDLLLNKLPHIDILINNVGIYKSQSFIETTDEDWHKQMEVNVMSGVRLSRHLLPKMLKADWGRIIFVSSECAGLVPADLIPYSSTKAAILSISRGLAHLTSGSQVTVNTIVPGSTLSQGAEAFLADLAQKENKSIAQIEAEFFSRVRSSSLLQRFASVDEVANTITYFASPLSAATNGAAIKVDGGSMGGII